ncbi:MAG: hypothetical protein U5R46_02140 [Gammaproteobacteria bacterium]|nr:hypothetical protein [Gammaproteobacteria bacterium]
MTHESLTDAGVKIDEVDGIVVGANDQYDGRAISVMMASGAMGGVERDILSTPSAGEHAFVLGALRVATGQFATQLVAAWSPTEASSLAEVQRLAADPYYTRRLPIDENASHALQASVLEHSVPGLTDTAQAIVRKNREQGAAAYPDLPSNESNGSGVRNPWPLRDRMIAPPVTGCVGLILASEDFIRERGIADVAWIQGMGWATEPSFLGDRDLGTLPGLRAAAKQAYRHAGVDDPGSAFNVGEVADQTPYQELLAYEGLGVCDRESWATAATNGDFAAGGRMPINLSGGALSFNPVFCTGLIRIAEVANQIRRKAGSHQKPGAEWGVAHAASGFAMQYNTVAVFGRGRQEAQ